MTETAPHAPVENPASTGQLSSRLVLESAAEQGRNGLTGLWVHTPGQTILVVDEDTRLQAGPSQEKKFGLPHKELQGRIFELTRRSKFIGEASTQVPTVTVEIYDEAGNLADIQRQDRSDFMRGLDATR